METPSPLQNKWLRVKPGVILTHSTSPVIVQLEVEFAKHKNLSWVTSVLRDAESQLDIIKQLAIQHKVAKEFPDILTATVQGIAPWKDDKGQTHLIYSWQLAWSRLLNKGVIVNPPLTATVLFDYMRDGVNKRGTKIGPSPHFKGTAFDIGGRDGVNDTIEDEIPIVKEAFDSGRIKGFKGYLIERKNNAVHCDCDLIPEPTIA